MFNESDYNENVEVCKYVWRKNIELDLQLDDEIDIQRVANLYAEKTNYEFGEEVKENDLVLVKIAKKYVTSEKFHKFGTNIPEYYAIRSMAEGLTSSHGGYGYNDSYDDRGLDEYDPAAALLKR